MSIYCLCRLDSDLVDLTTSPPNSHYLDIFSLFLAPVWGSKPAGSSPYVVLSCWALLNLTQPNLT